MSKEGSTISGLMDAFATSISIALQYGVPLRTLVRKFVHTRYEPSGMTSNPNIRIAKSITDYIFRWMALKFLSKEEQIEVGVNLDMSEATVESSNGHAIDVNPPASVKDANIATMEAKEVRQDKQEEISRISLIRMLKQKMQNLHSKIVKMHQAAQTAVVSWSGPHHVINV